MSLRRVRGGRSRVKAVHGGPPVLRGGHSVLASFRRTPSDGRISAGRRVSPVLGKGAAPPPPSRPSIHPSIRTHARADRRRESNVLRLAKPQERRLWVSNWAGWVLSIMIAEHARHGQRSVGPRRQCSLRAAGSTNGGGALPPSLPASASRSTQGADQG